MQFVENNNPNIIAVAGTWDPPLPRHIALLKELLRYSKKNGLNPYVFVFHPNPANLRHDNKYKDYFDLDTRLALLSRLGLNNVTVITFTLEGLRDSTANFFDELLNNMGIKLSELWVGENQSLGAGPGGLRSIGAECSARNIKLRILKNSFLVNLDKDDVNRNFRAGKFDLTKAVVGHYPTYKLTESRSVNMSDGVYSAMLRSDPFSGVNEKPATVTIANGHLSGIENQDGYSWLVLLERINEESGGLEEQGSL